MRLGFFRRPANVADALVVDEGSLVQRAGKLSNDRVLLLGCSTSGHLLELARAGCASTAYARPHDRVRPGGADVVLVPECPDAEIDHLARQAALALAPGGRMLVRIKRYRVTAAEQLRHAMTGAGLAVRGELVLPAFRVVKATPCRPS